MNTRSSSGVSLGISMYTLAFSILNVSKTTADRFLDEVKPKYVLEDANGMLCLNDELFVRGTLNKKISYLIWLEGTKVSDKSRTCEQIFLLF